MRKFSRLSIPIFIYTVISLVFTYPLLFNLNGALPGGADAFFYPWNIYEFQSKLRSFQNPFFTKDILYPVGANLFFHAYGAFTSIFAFPISLKTQLIFYQNLVLLSGLILSAFSAYLLTRYIIRSELPALIGGFIYGFSPMIFASISRGHYYFSHAEFLPLGLIILFEYLKKQTYKKALLLGVLFWLSFFNEYYQTVFLIIAFSLVGFFYVFSWEKGRKIGDYFKIFLPLGVALFIPGIFILPLFLPIFSQNFSRPLMGRFGAAEICSANSLQFLLPSQFNPFLAQISDRLSQILKVPPVPDTPSIYFGITVVVLSALTIKKLLRKEKWVAFFATLAGLGYFFSLGPIIKISRIPVAFGPMTPFWYYNKTPFINNARSPIRFSGIVMLALAVLAAFGLNQIMKNKRLSQRKLLVGLAIAAIVFEFFTFNFPETSAKIPKAYKLIADQKDQKTLLELPSGIIDGFEAFGAGGHQDDATFQMYLQAVHEKSRVGGYLARISNSTFEFYRTEPVISDLFKLIDQGEKVKARNYSEEEIIRFINEFNLGYIILWPHSNQKPVREYIKTNFSKFITSEKIQDGFIVIFIK